jgi:hypothetical protein
MSARVSEVDFAAIVRGGLSAGKVLPPGLTPSAFLIHAPVSVCGQLCT